MKQLSLILLCKERKTGSLTTKEIIKNHGFDDSQALKRFGRNIISSSCNSLNFNIFLLFSKKLVSINVKNPVSISS